MLVRQTAIYGLGNVLQSALAIGAVAIYTRLLTTVEYGSYSFAVTCVQFVYAFSVNWIATTIVRLYQKAGDHQRFLGAILVFYLGITALSALGTGIAMAALETDEQRRLAVFGFLYFAAMAWMELNLRFFQARLEAARQTRSRVARSVISTGLGGLLAYLGFGPEGVLLGLAAGSLIPGVLANVREWRGVRVGGDRPMRREIVQFGAPLAASFAIGALNVFAGRYMVSWMEGVTALGMFVLAFELANRTSQGLLTPIASAAAPISVRELEKSGQEAARALLRRSAILLVGLLAPAGAGLAAVSPDVVAIVVGPEFREGAGAVLPWLAVAAFATGFQMYYLDHAFHLGLKSHRLIWRASIMLATTLTLNYVLIGAFGMVGAGYAAVAAISISLVLTTLLGRTVFPLPFPLLQFAKILFATACMTAVVLAIPGEAGVTRLLAKVAAGAGVYGLLAFATDAGGLRTHALHLSARVPALRKALAALGVRFTD